MPDPGRLGRMDDNRTDRIAIELCTCMPVYDLEHF